MNKDEKWLKQFNMHGLRFIMIAFCFLVVLRLSAEKYIGVIICSIIALVSGFFSETYKKELKNGKSNN